jgi:hypothetical protein
MLAAALVRGNQVTEYELADLTGAAMSNFLTSFTVFVSIVTAYVIAAFTAGKRLSKQQVYVVNTCFLMASGAIGLLSVLIFQVFLRRARALGESEVAGPVTLDFTWVVATLYVVLVCGSLFFMRNVRQTTTND